MENLLEIRNLSKKFGSNCVLNDISFDIKSGEIVGLLGPNGAGKTTLIKIISGLINNYQGEIKLFGEKRNIDSKAKLAYLPDVNFIPQSWSVEKCVRYFVDFFDDFDKHKAMTLLRNIKIPHSAKFGTLSKGTKEKLQLILILSRKAELYLFDEPIAGVDPVARDLIFELIMENYNKKASIIISTHLVCNVQSILSSALFLKYGEIVTYDSIANLEARFETNDLEKIFKGLF